MFGGCNRAGWLVVVVENSLYINGKLSRMRITSVLDGSGVCTYSS